MENIVIVRTGGCKACGYCCTGAGCEHFINGLCAIHDHKPDECQLAPEYPMRKANPDCGYRFLIKGTDLEAIEILCSKVQE